MKVHLVTDDDAIDELTRLLFKELPDEVWAVADITRLSSIQSARRKLDAPDVPDLIILDGSVRECSTDPEPKDEAPAAEFLAQLKPKAREAPPVVVISKCIAHRLVYEVLQRWDVGVWTPGPGIGAGDGQFANVISTVMGRKPLQRQRQVTVTVGLKSARYTVLDGGYTFGLEREYKNSYQPDRLIKQIKVFKPYIDKKKLEGWHIHLENLGHELYELICEDIFGLDLIQRMRADNGALEFRFHFDPRADGELQELFHLPFEVMTENYSLDTFFCAAVPMSRWLADLPGPVDHSRSLRVLLIEGATSGVTTLRHERSGADEVVELDALRFASDIKNYFGECARCAQNGRQIELTVFDATQARGDGFRRQLRRLLTEGAFDIVHYYGHSVTFDGGTFLVAPDEAPGTGCGISVRAVADWIGQAAQKPRLLFLSSCQSGSVLTAMEMNKAGAGNVLGFRWEVSEDTVHRYVEDFYDAYLGSGRSISESFRDACHQALKYSQGDPIYTSAILSGSG